jgi:hypothetical protein
MLIVTIPVADGPRGRCHIDGREADFEIGDGVFAFRPVGGGAWDRRQIVMMCDDLFRNGSDGLGLIQVLANLGAGSLDARAHEGTRLPVVTRALADPGTTPYRPFREALDP